MMRQLAVWLETRAGCGSLLRRILNSEVPASAGWPQVLGGVALFAILVQAFTGVLLALNFAAPPGENYKSLVYIINGMTAGKIIHNMHYWGASILIVVVVAHMLQVFLYGAYKKPRELTWIAGVALLLLTLGFGLTGYLLPGDNASYWRAVVVTQIAEHVPLAGDVARRLLVSTGDLGALTFTRLFGIHVLVLPAFTVLLLALHIALVCKHGYAPAASDTRPKKRYFTGQALRDTLAIFVTFTVLSLLTFLIAAPLDRLADPADTSFIPRPEWYFLFLFEMLKFFSGSLEFVGSAVLPTVAILALILVPFIDRRPALRVARRTVALALVVLACIAWTTLTAAAVLTSPSPNPTVRAASGEHTAWTRLPPEKLVAIAGSSQRPTLGDVPEFAIQGAIVYTTNHCDACHRVNGQGGKVGPSLNGVAARHDRDWLQRHFADPQKVSPGSMMPKYKFSPQDLDQNTRYLLELPAN
ncbi:MAG: cytochrome b N-terminal domain-containing protein [Bryobacteraceae bacterium]